MTSSLWFVIARDLTHIGNDLAKLPSDLAQITTTIQVLLSTQQEPPSNTLLNPDQSQASTSQQPHFNFMPTVGYQISQLHIFNRVTMSIFSLILLLFILE